MTERMEMKEKLKRHQHWRVAYKEQIDESEEWISLEMRVSLSKN